MTRKKYLLIGFSVLLLAVMACNAIVPQAEPSSPAPTESAVYTLAPPPTQGSLPQTEGDVPRVSVEDAKLALDSGEAVIVDVRGAEAYAQVHITGALSIPLNDIEEHIANIPLEKDQWIITYCTWQNEHTSARAAFLMLQNGFSKVTPILGGLAAWMEAGYPTE